MMMNDGMMIDDDDDDIVIRWYTCNGDENNYANFSQWGKNK